MNADNFSEHKKAEIWDNWPALHDSCMLQLTVMQVAEHAAIRKPKIAIKANRTSPVKRIQSEYQNHH